MIFPFPAWASFRQSRATRMHDRVYSYLVETLDFCEVRYAKREDVADRTGVHKADVTRALRDLVHWGYVIEHDREPGGPRRFTLAWSLGGGKSPPHQPTGETVAVR